MHSAPTSGELHFLMTYIHELGSLLLRSPHPTPEIKEDLYKIKKELNSSVTTSLKDTVEEHYLHQIKKKS